MKDKAIADRVGSKRDFDDVLAGLQEMLSRSIVEMGVLDTQKPFKSLLEKIDQPGVDGVAMLRSFITTGSLAPAQELAVGLDDEEDFLMVRMPR